MKLFSPRLALTLFFIPAVALASSVPLRIPSRERLREYFQNAAAKSAPAPAGAEPHLSFASQAAAVTWVQSSASWLKSINSAVKFDVIAGSDPRQAKLQSYVHDLWRAYAELFPEFTTGLSEPPVVLVDGEQVNAFIPASPTTHQIAHVVVVFTGLLDLVGGVDNRDPLAGTMAHELAHSVFRHLLPEYKQRVNKFYRSGTVAFGFQAVPDPQLESRLPSWVEAASNAGEISSADLLDLPSPSISLSTATVVWRRIRADFHGDSADCKLLGEALQAWSGLFLVSDFENSIRILPDRQSLVAPVSQRLIDAQLKCLHGRKSFRDLLKEGSGLSDAVLDGYPELVAAAKVFDQAPDLVSAIRGFVAPYRKVMRDVEQAIPDFGELEYFTAEEHADDSSAIVMAYLGQNPEGVSLLLTKLLSQSNPQSLEKCYARLAQPGTPANGTFADPHRSECFRLYHMQKLHAALPADANGLEAFAHDFVAHTLGKP